MNYAYEDIKNFNKEIITLEEASSIYKKYGIYLNCSNGSIIEFIEEL